MANQLNMRRHLRAATSTAHERVEAAFAPFDLATRGGLANFLKAHDSALRSACAGLRAEQRAQVEELRAAVTQDFRELGTEPASPGGSTLLAGHDSRGVMYVIAGSRLGSQILRRRVAASGDAAVRRANAYLASEAGDRLWPATLAELSRVRPEEAAGIVSAALATFEVFESAAARVAVDRTNVDERAIA
jgi:heme oxygenase